MAFYGCQILGMDCSPRVDTEAGPKLCCNTTVVLTMVNGQCSEVKIRSPAMVAMVYGNHVITAQAIPMTSFFFSQPSIFHWMSQFASEEHCMNNVAAEGFETQFSMYYGLTLKSGKSGYVISSCLFPFPSFICLSNLGCNLFKNVFLQCEVLISRKLLGIITTKPNHRVQETSGVEIRSHVC